MQVQLFIGRYRHVLAGRNALHEEICASTCSLRKVYAETYVLMGKDKYMLA
jgi:hypothetical protein